WSSEVKTLSKVLSGEIVEGLSAIRWEQFKEDYFAMRKTLVLMAVLTMQAGPALACDHPTFEENHIKQTALIPLKVVSFASGVVVGTPIAIARCEARRMDTYTASFAKEFERNDKWVTPMMVASIPGQTMRVAGTVAEGVFNGIGNAFLSSIKEPFSERVYSLKQLESLD
ncbi:MAG: hypothetical protein C0507_22040, partial [Cyanobacteria bacterium PR.3.49]|nr:hypothetical protein [Cyanobacteria bacterium PR.3.49]